MQQVGYSPTNLIQTVWHKSTDLGMDDESVCREKLAGTGKAYVLKGTRHEIIVCDPDCVRIGIRIACHLAKNPIIPSGRGENDCRAQLG